MLLNIMYWCQYFGDHVIAASLKPLDLVHLGAVHQHFGDHVIAASLKPLRLRAGGQRIRPISAIT